jgi:hypothetical protein
VLQTEEKFRSRICADLPLLRQSVALESLDNLVNSAKVRWKVALYPILQGTCS